MWSLSIDGGVDACDGGEAGAGGSDGVNLQPAIPMTQQEYEVLAIITCHVAAWNGQHPDLARHGVKRIQGLGQLGDVCIDRITFEPTPKPRKSA